MEKREKLALDLLEILACPTCKGDLVYNQERDLLICPTCRVYYEIKEGIPDLIPQHAKPLKEISEKMSTT
ncbi:MAG TPA: Trm112 family protein [Aquifex aeolicus]|uniref:Trm112 family protein n=1 Tax=Aquifex aeolicus TaxID=63363 RepID=A0A9D0YPR2_AQUAO|nr:Trm112 family protein [Aquificales bacterium]HIP86586.1 Trm112 family protein [Aquifex sp.]HIP98751.1 Trm112 family protein [Aquifex aeolicus]HIQ26379.1 Trm112 family protein [Aquifex aeolicus]